MGTYFRQAGYETHYVGKWHLCFKPTDTDSHGFETAEWTSLAVAIVLLLTRRRYPVQTLAIAVAASAVVIAVHIVGMFAFAPLVGRYADWAGPIRSVQVGAVILGVGTITSVAAGYVPALIFVGLFLLGLGWSFGLIGGMTLLTGSVPASSRVEVQGAGDLTLSVCGAAAALASGFVKASLGFHVLANLATALAAALLVFAWYTEARQRSSAA